MEEKKLREFLEIPLLSFYDHARLLSRALIRPSFETSSCQGERRHEDDLSPDRYKFDFITWFLPSPRSHLYPNFFYDPAMKYASRIVYI